MWVEKNIYVADMLSNQTNNVTWKLADNDIKIKNGNISIETFIKNTSVLQISGIYLSW